MEKLREIVFYNIDKSIRSYRIFAQKQLKAKGYKLTIDQWLLIKCIMENPEISQQEMSEIIFKDNASITRMVELLVKAKYLIRKPYSKDRRRVKLIVSELAVQMINEIHHLAIEYRQVALQGVSREEIEIVNKVTNSIILNCRQDNSEI